MALTEIHAAITEKQAQLIAGEFILDHVGDQVLAGDPWPIHSALGSAWVVPMILTQSAFGPVGVIGVVVIDENTGQVIASTPADTLNENTDRLLKGQGSVLETAFQETIAKGHMSS
ncbi:MAG TPA: hypothetical protein EYP41_14830 [Anaerolineae bacterium]|nr:hypothetical protein [Anaerolineae bacterium]